MEDIKPHSMVGYEAFTETEVEIKEPRAEMPEMEINIAEVIEVADISIEDIEVVVDIDDVVEQVLTPIDGNVVSPVGGEINWADIFDPNNPSRNESDATPI